MRDIDWNGVQEAAEFEKPKPGAYIAQIVRVKDVEEKEYLWIEWDFAEGAYKGNNQETYDRAGFWPCTLIRSYKNSALGFFKAFKTAVEESNPGYTFACSNPGGLQGKLVGIVLGEEEYRKKDGGVGIRNYVFQTRSVLAIRDGNFKVPARKKLERAAPATGPAPAQSWADDIDGDQDIPF